jgi:hypothetical protein
VRNFDKSWLIKWPKYVQLFSASVVLRHRYCCFAVCCFSWCNTKLSLDRFTSDLHVCDEFIVQLTELALGKNLDYFK